jgi:gas vesicle protein
MGNPMSTNNSKPKPVLKKRKTKTKPVLFSLLILLSGIIIGFGAALIVVRQSGINRKPALPEEFSRRMVKHLTRELHLTEEQQKKVKPIIEKHMKVMDQIRSEARPKIRQELEEMNKELMAVFDNTQQQIWKERIRQMQQRFPGMHQHRHGPGDKRPPRQNPHPEGQQPHQFQRQRPDAMPPDEQQLPPPDEDAPLDDTEPLLPQEPIS